MFSFAFDKLLDAILSANAIDLVAGLAAIWALRMAYIANRKTLKTTRLRGPPSPSILFGADKSILESPDSVAVYEAWYKEYGAVYEIPMVLGQRRTILCDPKALAHFFSRDSSSYGLTPATKVALAKSVGKGVLWADGEIHRRQRKSLAPAFNSASIRKLTPVFYDASHKLKTAWEAIIDADGSGSAIIEIQNWMNHTSLDSIGLAGFAYDFASLDGKKGPVSSALEAFGASKPSSIRIRLLLLMRRFPVLFNLPTYGNGLLNELHKVTADISKTLFERAKREKEGHLDGKEDSSVTGLLIKTEDAETNTYLTGEEVIAQMMTLLVAGYETTAITMTWALLELARHPEIQKKLREEILAFDGEPTYDQFFKGFPYFDAVVHEIFRLHPAVPEMIRVAKEDDIIPLSQPVHTKSGEVVHDLFVPRGAFVGIPIIFINRSDTLWGADAKDFRPERWLETNGITKQAQELQGYRHLLTFGDGPKTCLGKLFAIIEVKTVLWVVVKNFVLEMKDGPDTQVANGQGILPRPSIVGEAGTEIPLRVKRYDG
ncbi:cytochrome P450 [Scleroderma yunnanense]